MTVWHPAHRIKRRERFDIDTAIAHFGVLIFPGQDLSDAQQITFSQRFSEIENEHGGNPTQKKKRLNAQIKNVSDLNTDGTPLARDDRRRAFNLGSHLWHTDSSFRAVPAKCSLLSARRKTIGGDEATVT